MKSANITSATARHPLAAAPAAAPVKPSSQMGVSISRSATKFLPQSLGVREAAAALAGPLAHVDDVFVAAHFLGDAVANRFQPGLHPGFSRRPLPARAADGAARPTRGRSPWPGRAAASDEQSRRPPSSCFPPADRSRRVPRPSSRAGRNQLFAKRGDRAARQPMVEFFLCSVRAGERIAFMMADDPIGLGFDQGRSVPGAGPLDGLSRGAHARPARRCRRRRRPEFRRRPPCWRLRY